MKALLRIFHHFIGDQRGSIAISFILVFTTMLGSTLFAIDMARYNIAQSRLQNALDLTLISVGRNLPQYQINLDGDEGAALKQDIIDYFYANIPESFLGAEIPSDSLTVSVTLEGNADPYPGAQRIALSAQGKLPMLSTGFFDFAAMDLHASNAAIRRVRNDMEMVLALDNSSTVTVGTQQVDVTASDNQLIDSLKSEAKKLADTVLDAGVAAAGANGVSGTYVGVVPFTDFVNVKNVPTVRNWLRIRPAQADFITGPSWGGCISEPLPVAGGWKLPGGGTSTSLPASALSPSSGFMPVFTVFGYEYEVGELDLTKSSYNNRYLVPNPDMQVDNGGIAGIESVKGLSFDQHDNSDEHPPRAIVVRPYKWPASYGWGYSGFSWPHRANDGTDHAHDEPHHFWVNFATDSTYISGMAGNTKIRTCQSSTAQFLSQDKTVVDNAIGAMKNTAIIKVKGVDTLTYGYGGGATVPVGLLWSWRMLSPNWRGATYGWGSDTLPRDPGLGLRKIIVLFANRGNYPLTEHGSDGYITQPMKLSYAYWDGSTSKTVKVSPVNIDIDLTVPDPNLPPKKANANEYFTQCPLNGLRMLDPETLDPLNYKTVCTFDSTDIGYGNDTASGLPGSGLTTTTVDAYMADVCRNIQGAGIELYTVTLGTNYSINGKALIKGCASSEDKYFDAGNIDDLSKAFKTIAGNVTDFRLIE